MFLPDVSKDTPVETWLVGSTYMMPSIGRYIQYVDRINPITSLGILGGFIPISPLVGTLMIESRIFGANIPEYFSRLGYEVATEGAVVSNYRLQSLLNSLPVPEFNTPGFNSGMETFRYEMAQGVTQTYTSSPDFPVPYKSLGIVTMDESTLSEQHKFEYFIYRLDAEWIEEQLNTSQRKLPFLIPGMDGVFLSFNLVHERYRDYIINRENASYESKVFAKIMFLADADIYTTLFRSLYDNNEAYRNPEFLTGICKMSDMLAQSALLTGV